MIVFKGYEFIPEFKWVDLSPSPIKDCSKNSDYDIVEGQTVEERLTRGIGMSTPLGPTNVFVSGLS